VLGERQQGPLEPVLTTPIRREEFLLGKALAVLVPSVAIAYVVFAVFLAVVAVFAQLRGGRAVPMPTANATRCSLEMTVTSGLFVYANMATAAQPMITPTLPRRPPAPRQSRRRALATALSPTSFSG